MISNIETNLGKSVVPMILGGYIDFQHALRRLDFQFSQDVVLIFNRFGMPQNTAFLFKNPPR